MQKEGEDITCGCSLNGVSILPFPLVLTGPPPTLVQIHNCKADAVEYGLPFMNACWPLLESPE